MQNQPDLGELLVAIGRFLDQDVRPLLKEHHSGLAFRALIASNLCQLAAAELSLEEAQDELELEGLSALYPDAESARDRGRAKRSQRREALAALNRRLAEELRAGLADERRRELVSRHLMDTLRSRLMTVNPRFDSASDIP